MPAQFRIKRGGSMRQAMKGLSLSLILGVVSSCAHAQEATISYEPVTVQLSGKVMLESHYGPPGYGSSPRVDKVLRVPVLVLANPVTVQGNPHDPRSRFQIDQDTFQHVTRMQMTSGTLNSQILGSVGKDVTVSGTLFEKIFGENFTDVMIGVKGISIALPSGTPH